MFTGLVETIGEVLSRKGTDQGGVRFCVRASAIAGEVRLGDSVAVNGCCLTVSEKNGDVLSFDLLQETLARTSLGKAQIRGRVNLERALAAGGRLGGHFVQGHVDCTAAILGIEPSGADVRLEIALPAGGAQYFVPKGSIAVDGISLTVAELKESSFVVWIIPHTLAATNLGSRSAGDFVNLEYDVLAKYVERMLAHRSV
jgi:riboflavin synthase